MQNLDIRQAIQKERFKHYEIAEKLNISEFTFCRKLRKELSKKEKDEIFEVIEKLKEENY